MLSILGCFHFCTNVQIIQLKSFVDLFNKKKQNLDRTHTKKASLLDKSSKFFSDNQASFDTSALNTIHQCHEYNVSDRTMTQFLNFLI